MTTEDGSIVPLHNWSLSYEYGLAKPGTSPLFAPTARKTAWELYVGKKAYPIAGQVLTIAYAETMRSTESDTGVKTEKIKTPRDLDPDRSGRAQDHVQGGGARARAAGGIAGEGHHVDGADPRRAGRDGHGHQEGLLPRRATRPWSNAAAPPPTAWSKSSSRNSMNANEIRAKYRKYLYGLATYYKEALPLVRGEGKWLFDADGKKYLDFFGGIVTVSLGHCDPRVVEAIETQARTLQHVSTLFPTVPIVELAETLAGLFPGEKPAKVFFTNSGTEAIETAILTARLHTERTEIVALRHGYHGRSMLAMSLTAHAGWRLGGVQDGQIRHAIAPYCYRCPLKLKYPECGVACAEDVEDVIKTTTSGRPAAFIAEPIMGVGGFITPPKEYPGIVAEIVRRYGALYIADEVQTGWGRTGGKWFGIEQYGVKPDIIVARQEPGQRPPDRRHGGARRGRRLVQGLDHRHLRRQPRDHGRGQGRGRRHRRRPADGQRHRRGRPPPQSPRGPRREARRGRRGAGHGPDAGRRAGEGQEDQGAGAAAASAVLEAAKDHGPDHRQGRPLRQRAAHLARAQRRRGRRGPGGGHPRQGPRGGGKV